MEVIIVLSFIVFFAAVICILGVYCSQQFKDSDFDVKINKEDFDCEDDYE